MGTASFYLVFFLSAIAPVSFPAWGGSSESLSFIEAHLDRGLEQKFDPARARDFTYEILARLEGWLADSNLSPKTTPTLIRILSKARGLSTANLSPWDESFLRLIAQVVPDEMQLQEKETNNQKVGTKRLVNEIRFLLGQIKIEELLQIKLNLSGVNLEASRHSSTETLAKVASWLSTIQPPRELTSDERVILSDIVSTFQKLSDGTAQDQVALLKMLDSELNPKVSIWTFFSSKRLRRPVSSESLERMIYGGLKTGSKFTDAMKQTGEPGLRAKILDFLPEDEVRSKGQVSRDWRAIVHRYQTTKAFPPGQLPQDRAQLEDELRKSPFLSEEERQAAIRESEFSGYREYRAFLRAIHTAVSEHQMSSKEDPFRSLHVLKTELKKVIPHISERSQIGRLCHEIVQFDPASALTLSDTGKSLIGDYETLARTGNIYAQQTVAWIREFAFLGTKEQEFFYPDFPHSSLPLSSISKITWPESFPDFHLYLKWNEAVSNVAGNPFRGDFTQNAALTRLYRRPYARFSNKTLRFRTEPWIQSSPMELADLKNQTFYHHLKERQLQQSTRSLNDIFAQYSHCIYEASSHAAQGDFQGAVSVLETKLSQIEAQQKDGILPGILPEKEKLKDNLFFYFWLLSANTSEMPLLSGKDEKTQKVISDLLKGRRHEIFQHRLRTFWGQSDLDLFLSHSPSLSAARLLTSLRSLLFSRPLHAEPKFLSYIWKAREIEALYWAGDGVQQTGARASDGLETADEEISALDSLLRPGKPQPPNDIPEFEEARALLQNLIDQHSGDPLIKEYIIDMLIRRGRVADLTDWLKDGNAEPSNYHRLATAFSKLKEFETAVFFFERAEQEMRSQLINHPEQVQLWLTRFAQAYFETEDFENTLRVLAYKKDRFNFVDHAFRIQALTKLEKKTELQAALVSKEQHERLVLLPDLKQAASMYEEDGDFVRAEQVLSRVDQLERTLGENTSLRN